MAIVRDPGKFEGEPEYAQVFWERALDGGADETVYDGDTPHEVFALTEADCVEFPDDLGPEHVGQKLVLWESDQGFVNTALLTQREYEHFIADLEEADDDDR